MAPRGEFTSLGEEYRAFGELGRNGPLRGNQQIFINSPGFSSGWRIVAASPVFVDVTLRPEGSSAFPQDSAQTKMDTAWAYEGHHFWLRGIHTSDKNGNACITGTTEFQNFLQNLALDAHDALHRKRVIYGFSVRNSI